MRFQVIAEQRMKAIKLEQGGIEFHRDRSCASAKKEQITVPTGYAKISTKEQTLVDLVRFHSVCGCLSNVAMVIRDLAEGCQAEILTQVVASENMELVLQRLGYILELLEFSALATIVEEELKSRKVYEIFLKPDFHTKEGEFEKRCQRSSLNNFLFVTVMQSREENVSSKRSPKPRLP